MKIENGILIKVDDEDIVDGKCIVPEGVTKIGKEAFSRRSSLKKINIPKGVTEIGAHSFAWCTNLEKIELPEEITILEDFLFEGCQKLEKVVIPQKVTSIGGETFLMCESLNEVEIPIGVEEIGYEAFAWCHNLEKINIPKGLKKINANAFYECTGLKEINIPKEVKVIANDAFKGCSNIKDVKYSKEAPLIQSEEIFKSLIYVNKELAKKILFKENLKKIDEIKSKANFEIGSQDYDEKMMNIFYFRMINSIGIDEIEKMIQLPNLTKKEIEQYTLEKDEVFQELYETQYSITGDFGKTLKILKQLNKIKNKEETKKNSREIQMFKMINEKLEEGYEGTISELILNIVKDKKIEVEPEYIENLMQTEKEINTEKIKENLQKVESKIEASLETANEQYPEPIVYMQIEPIKIMISDTLKKIFRENGKLDVKVVKEELESKLENANAEYIRQKKQQIVDNTLELFKDEEFYKTINDSTFNAMKRTKEQIGRAWKYKINQMLGKIGYTFDNLPKFFSKEEIEFITEKLQTNTSIEMQTESVSKPKRGIEKEKAYELLLNKKLPQIVTYKQIHDMFGSVREPHSENFKEFFKKNRKEFLENPKYFSNFGVIHNNFEMIINSPELKNIYKKGELTLDKINEYLSELQYSNQRPGDEELAKFSKSIAGITTDDEFEHVQKVFDITKKRERTAIPPVMMKKEKFRGRMLSPDDVLNLFAGNITTCCQRFGDEGEGSMLIGSIEENGGIFVIEEIDKKGNTVNIIGQSLTIRQKGKDGNYDRLTFDNIEIDEKTGSRLSEEEHKQILDIYIQASQQAIEKDKKFLGKLLSQGKITQKQYDSLVLKEVIAGIGCNDLNGLDKLPKAEISVPDEAFYRYKFVKEQEGYAWMDSTGEQAPLGSSGVPVILAKMKENELAEIKNKERKIDDKTVVKPKDIPLWYGKVGKVQDLSRKQITEEKINIIKQIEKSVFREKQQILKHVENVDDLEDSYELENAKVKLGSNNDWYLVYEEDEEKFTIADFAVIGGINSEKNQIEDKNIKSNPKLAVAESAYEMYKLLIETKEKKKKLICNATSDTSLVNIKRMMEKGAIDVKTLEGENVVYKKREGLVYEESGKKVESQDWLNDRRIKMFDLEIIPNLNVLKKEYKKVEEFLDRTQDTIKMKGAEKEEGIDELRQKMREVNKYDER